MPLPAASPAIVKSWPSPSSGSALPGCRLWVARVTREGRPVLISGTGGERIGLLLTMGFYVLVDTNTWKYVEGGASVSPQSGHLLLGVTHIRELQSTYSVKFR